MRSIVPFLLILASACEGSGVLTLDGISGITDTAITDTDTPDDPVVVGSPTEDNDGDGWTEANGDCDDSNVSVFPQPNDAIDPSGIDHNCDGVDGVDNDGDGAAVNGRVPDCNDADNAVFPEAPEVHYNGVDDDCDPSSPDDDVDGDGYFLAEDCHDGDPTRNPGAVDLENNVDDNCDEAVDNFRMTVNDVGVDTRLYIEGMPATQTYVGYSGYSDGELWVNDDIDNSWFQELDGIRSVSLLAEERVGAARTFYVGDFTAGCATFPQRNAKRLCITWGGWDDPRLNMCDRIVEVPAPTDLR